MVDILITCPFCEQEHKVSVENEEGFFLWYNGMGLIQDVLPDLSPTKREQLISGICPACQKKVFS